MRHYAADDSVFLNHDYLIKGVAGAILWKLVRERVATGRSEFTNRELRLDACLRLPAYAENLEARLLLLQRRLCDRQSPIRIEKTGRGRFRLNTHCVLALEEVGRTEVGPGATNRTVARVLADHGFAFPLGHCGTVALSGYLLGGGFGWNSGLWGMAAFNVESVDVVTADGVLRRASETENADIFWAARGAGPAFFGVVTGYRLRLRLLPRAVTTSVWTYDLWSNTHSTRPGFLRPTRCIPPRARRNPHRPERSSAPCAIL